MKARNAMGALAGIAVVGLALAGCSGSDSPASSSSPAGSATAAKIDGTGKTVHVMIAANGLYPEQQKTWFGEVSDKFKAETGATVEFETFASANDELTKIQTSVLSGQGPDVYSLGTTFTPTAYATGAFMTLGDAEWAQVGGRDKFVPSTLGISGPDEKNEIAVPFASRPFVMAYNKDLLAAAGITDLPTTWDELTDDAKKLTTGDVHGLAIGYADGFDPWKFIWGMSIQAGNPILNLEDGKAQIDVDPTQTAYQTYFDWYSKDKVVDPAALGWKNAQAVAAFADGKAGFVPMVSATSRVTLDKSAVAGKYAYALMPTVPPGMTTNPGDGKPATSIISGDNMVVAKYSKNQDLALALINMLTSTENQTSYNKTFGDLPTNQEAATAIQTGDELLKPVLESSAGAIGTPFSGAWGDTQLALTNVVVQALPALQAGGVSESDLKAALQTAQSTAQASLDKAK
ncbi:ABC transporter substrate-binding protein [Cellulomonas sp. URHD0024]|uniref:ABC transporter substrate-binding protein n=1 Tax=Cellulomonas sp. URHD0024 TaxID=1302620 RepID=UPI000405FD39|nr:extracellular solute-binding protein [Cellulomonas sp. URHD0024]